MNIDIAIKTLEKLATPEKVTFKQNKYGIRSANSLGIYHRDLKLLAKDIGIDNELAIELFDTGIYEAKILCSKIFDPADITIKHIDKWVATFETWEI